MGVNNATSWLFRYVDNWYLFSRAGDTTHPARWALLTNFLAKIGCDLHEEQSGSVVKALGWEWCDGFFRCPSDKYEIMMVRLCAWNLAASTCEPFTFEEVEKVIGLLLWASTALPVILPAIASLRKAAHCSARCPSLRNAPFVLNVQATAAVSLLFFSLSGWDQKRSLFLGFSPVALAEIVVRTDASTDFGAGGFMWPSFDGFIHGWSAGDRESSLLSSDEHVRESTMYFELRAIRIALDVFGGVLRGRRVQFESDSECAIQCLQKCYSGRPRCQSIIRDIIAICVSLRISPRWEHISACFNDIADCLSHDRLFQAQAHCESEFGAQLRVTSCPQ
jgi:hypothetical protein